MSMRLTLILVLTGLVVIFIVQNVAVVEIRFLFWSLSMSRAIFMFLLLVIGIVIGWVLRGHMKHKA